MFCFRCGTSMPDTSVACPQCGTAVADAPQVAPPPLAPPAAAPWSSTPQQLYFDRPRTDGKAVASLICGILSLMCFTVLAGIPAVILGHLSKSDIRKSQGRLQGDGIALAGLITGYAGIAFGLLIIPAIVIPNLLRTRMQAHASGAASTVRTLNTAQVTYQVRYPDTGYGRDLATLGPGTATGCSSQGPSAQHACLIDSALGSARCTTGKWCAKNGYNFTIVGVCPSEGSCTDYIVTATPLGTSTEGKSFCSTNDAVVRYKTGPPLRGPVESVDDCQSWPEL